MKLKHLILLGILISYSCSSDDNSTEDNCKLLSYQSAQLYYEYLDRNLFGATNSFSLNFDGVNLVYDNQNRISGVSGGPRKIPSGPNLSEWIMSNDVAYSITYSGNTVTTTSVVTSFFGETNNVYTISASKIDSRSVILLVGLIYDTVHFTYEYGNNKVLEYKNNALYRTFYFEDDNLLKVEELRYGNLENPFGEPNTLVGKFEIVFSEFDILPNLLEGKFYLDGAFFKAFSKNNYHKIERLQYIFNQETQTFEFIDIVNFRSFNFGFNADGSTALFATDCPI